MMHHEFQAARRAASLSRTARRRLVREAEKAQRAAKAARIAADGTASGVGGREHRVRAGARKRKGIAWPAL
ncbi:hypothetical protein ACQB60_09525 [Actinomycetota bacterium Odt1-20B]